ncbi:nitroreductase family protein [Sphingorhabdus sp. EL138]|uniref:Acg family FMN-binding oxidoreductase n=1 Tax=Sphingorhabdus sp. EL138 TaxID=2073156 RepID=UPI000D696A2D|nr:nitroreductase family protein [Sphingorhabdus sp. EL138]
MVSRRRVLVTGGASLVLLGGGFGAYVGTRSIAKAQEPWIQATTGFGDPRLDALAYAILAPNPHNRQPWQVRLMGNDSFTVYCDLDKRLPHTDPPNRQITIGFGTFLELFRQAAAEKGYRAEIMPFPEGEPEPVLDSRPIASVKMIKDPSVPRDPLFGTILNRRSTKEAFTPRSVDDATFAKLQDMAFAGQSEPLISLEATSDAERVARLRKLNWQAWSVEYDVARTQKESVDLMRIGAGEVNANPDGIDMSGPMMEALRLGGIVSRKELATKGSTAYESGISMYREILDNTSSFGWLISPDNRRITQLQSGAVWVRINQAATALGLAMHPVSQILQEFPEMAHLYDQYHKYLGIAAPARVQGFFRFGYAASPEPSPRWPVESFILNV